MDRALLAICALLVNAVLGGPWRWYEALGAARLKAYPIRLLRDLERRLNRENRSAEDRFLRGCVLVGAGLLTGFIAGAILGWILQFHLQLIEVVLIAALLPLRSTWDRVRHIRKALASGDIAPARQAFDGTAWRHAALLDEYGLARAAVEMMAVNFSEKVVAPLLWYVFLGLPGIFACWLLSLMQESLSQQATDFGKPVAYAHDAVQYLPARVTALLWVLASLFLPSANIQEIGARLTGDLVRLPSSMLALRTASLTLGIALGGPTSAYARGIWLGGGNPKATPADISRALYALALLGLFLFLLLGILM